MRKVIGTAGIVAAGLGLLISMAAAAAPDQQTPDAKAYLSFSFGGAKAVPRALHYGLRLDHDRSFLAPEQSLPPLMQMDFSRRGLGAISVNGLNVLRPAFRANQNEDAADDEIEEDEGFFESIGNWFGGLFGDDEDEAEETAADDSVGEPAAEGEAAETEPSEGYDAIDWGLLAIGAVGIGFVAAEVIDGEDDPDPAAGGGDEGGPPPCGIGPPPGPLGCQPPVGPPLEIPSFTGRSSKVFADSRDYQQWLDSGTGQMGDLY